MSHKQEIWTGPCPFLRTWQGVEIGERASFVVTLGGEWMGAGVYAVEFESGLEAICRLDRRIDQSRRWRVLPEGGAMS